MAESHLESSAESRVEGRTERKLRRRREKKRAREIRRTVLAIMFVLLQLLGFLLANFAPHDSWGELVGFLLLQPSQIVVNLLDSHFQWTRGLRDADAVLLVTLLSLPLNVLFWHRVWRGWRTLRKAQRRRRRAAGAPYGAAPDPSKRYAARPTHSVSLTVGSKPQLKADVPAEARPDAEAALRK